MTESPRAESWCPFPSTRNPSPVWSGTPPVRSCSPAPKRRRWSCGLVRTCAPTQAPGPVGAVCKAWDTHLWWMVQPGAAWPDAAPSPSACLPCRFPSVKAGLQQIMMQFNLTFDGFSSAAPTSFLLPFNPIYSVFFFFFSCCQNGLVSVWTVPQDVSNYPESSSSDSEGWWENEAKPKLMVLNRNNHCLLIK